MSRTAGRWPPSPRTALGALGIGVAAIAIVWSGPLWGVLGAFALGSLYVVGTAPLAVAFGQVALVAAGPSSPGIVAAVEVGLFLALLAAALSAPAPRTAAATVAVTVPLFGGLTWLALSSWQVGPMAVALVLGCGFATAAYLLHRYLLVSVGIVSRDQLQSSPTNE
ncbi:hypothetical protein [Haloarcula salina]|uniref:DUF8163 domain-containing protein n=1 Tax=Haloarcula salina TaxID=1429914 RepID=A0AA41G2S1_9EURY|nr:hypothetical protein [Haloarcula salina]MBV0903290.1 hypothetical protein [Haloarcula salina]